MVEDDKVEVSVCCLAYNHEKYLRKTLEGFASQKTNFRYEVIIHDDASTDKTKSIIEEFRKKYPAIIKPIFQIENQYSKGIGITDEYIYPQISGKYVCYCEGDDYWCDEYKLQKQFNVLEEHPECSICIHKVQCINEDGSVNERVIPGNHYQIKEGIIEDDVLCQAFWIRGGYPFHTSSYFVRRSVIDRLLRDRVSIYSYFNGDVNILRASFCEGKFYYMNEVMSKRRLFSIGSWNSRKMQWGLDKKVDFTKKQLRGEIIFNDYTNQKYADYIKVAIAKNILGWGIYDIREAQNQLKNNGICCNVFVGRDIHGKIKQSVILICILYFPFIIDWLRKIKERNDE